MSARITPSAPTDGAPTTRLGMAVLLACAFTLQTALVDAAAKFLAPELHPLQIVWGYLMAIMLLVCGYYVLGGFPRARYWKTSLLPLQMLRPLFLVGTIGLLFIGLTELPLTTATAITFSAPLFVTALSRPLLGERVGIHRWIAVVVGLAGVLVLLRPGGGEVVAWAALITLASAVSFALMQIVTRRLSATEPLSVTLFHTAFWGAVWSSLLVPFVWRPAEPWHWAAFLGLGVFGVGAHLCMIAAARYAEASQLAPFHYVKLIWVTALGYLIWNHVPGPGELLGAAIIIGSGLYIFWRERRQRAATRQ